MWRAIPETTYTVSYYKVVDGVAYEGFTEERTTMTDTDANPDASDEHMTDTHDYAGYTYTQISERQKVDEYGNLVWKQKVDADGNPVWKQKVDEQGNPVFVQLLDEDGNPVYEQERDADGGLVYQPKRDEFGNIE